MQAMACRQHCDSHSCVLQYASRMSKHWHWHRCAPAATEHPDSLCISLTCMTHQGPLAAQLLELQTQAIPLDSPGRSVPPERPSVSWRHDLLARQKVAGTACNRSPRTEHAHAAQFMHNP
jgi:hypothetical protein